jgi:hypothetical protein
MVSDRVWEMTEAWRGDENTDHIDRIVADKSIPLTRACAGLTSRRTLSPKSQPMHVLRDTGRERLQQCIMIAYTCNNKSRAMFDSPR